MSGLFKLLILTRTLLHASRFYELVIEMLENQEDAVVDLEKDVDHAIIRVSGVQFSLVEPPFTLGENLPWLCFPPATNDTKNN